MEDWWLVQDSKGDTGWMLSRMMDVDAPDTLTRYSEGQRMVGAYVLTTVNDPEAEQASDQSNDKKGNRPVKHDGLLTLRRRAETPKPAVVFR